MRAARLLLVLLSLALPGAAGDRATRYVVIGHPGSVPARVDRDVLADVFLKKSRDWPGDGAAHPVDLPPQSPLREDFTREVLGRSVGAVRIYWAQQLFSGRDLPPPELGEAQVIEYVRATRGAVGYVSARQPLGDLVLVQVE